MREVAARAGVSAKTVSRVHTDDPHVLPATRARVEQAMRELNYVPNVTATTFRAGISPVIGVAVPSVTDPFFATIVRAVDDVARERGLSTLVTSLGDSPETERGILESLLSRRPTGLIVAPVGIDHAWMKRWLEHTPIVFVDRAPKRLIADSFTENDEAGAHAATQHLVKHGHRRIAYLGDMTHLSTEMGRMAGYRRALTEAAIDIDENLLVDRIASRDDAQRAVAQLRASNDPVTAVFSANARSTMSAFSSISDAGLALVGFGDFPLADALTPAVTVIDQDPTRMGRAAIERLFQRAQRPGKRLKRATTFEVQLIERASSRQGGT